MFKPLAQIVLLGSLLAIDLAAVEREIYFTDFEDAPVGDDQLVGFDGWNGTPTGRGSHGIDEAAVEGLGHSAFIGFNPPGGSAPARVLRGVSHNPVAGGEPIVRLAAVIGVNDSDNSPFPGQEPPRDLFFISFFNASGTTLASLTYNNTEAAFGLWRDDGVDTFDTDEEFIRGEAQLLLVEIDYPNNTWTVELDGFPIFRDAPFTALTGVDMNLGGVAIVWQRSSFQWGNNWMLFDDWSVLVDTIKSVIPEDPFKVISIALDPSNCAVLTWKAQPGFSYRVEYSDDMINWLSDLPDSTKIESTEKDVSYTDTSSAGLSRRFYRVVRSDTP